MPRRSFVRRVLTGGIVPAVLHERNQRDRERRHRQHRESRSEHREVESAIREANRQAERQSSTANRENRRQYGRDVRDLARNQVQARQHRGRERRELGRARVDQRRAAGRYRKDMSQYRSDVRQAIRDQRSQNSEAMRSAREGRHLLEKYGPEKFMQYNALNPQQQQLLDYETNRAQQRAPMEDIRNSPLYQQATGNLQNLLSNNPQDLEAFRAPEMREFNEQTVPDIANRFAGANALSSSGFQNALGHAATSLHEKLNMQRAQLRQGALDRALGYAQQPYANQIAQNEIGQRSSQLGLGTNPYHSIYRPPTIPGQLQPGGVQIPQPSAPNMTPLGAGPAPVPYQNVQRPQQQYPNYSGATAGPRPQYQHSPGMLERFAGAALPAIGAGAGMAFGGPIGAAAGSAVGSGLSGMFQGTPAQAPSFTTRPAAGATATAPQFAQQFRQNAPGFGQVQPQQQRMFF